jgi:hypothetical protein
MNGSSAGILAVAWLSIVPGLVLAQDPSDLIAAGRFDEAVASLSGADSVEAEVAAREIFNQTHTFGIQENDFDYAIRGLAAAKNLPNLSRELAADLHFWHGFALYQKAVQEQGPQTVASAEVALHRFREALEQFRSIGATPGDPSPTGVDNLPMYVNNTETYIEIQEAIIDRDR